MDEKSTHELGDGVDHVLHGVEDVADVVGHGAAGTVKGLADGVESASADTQARDEKSHDDHA